MAQPEERFKIDSAFGEESRWTHDYLNDAWSLLVRLMDNVQVDPPMGIQVRLKKDKELHGIAGYASSSEIGFTSNVWPKDRDRLWILAHELVNLFACHYGGAGGFPSDWWSNGRSPFPEYVSCLVMEELGYKEAAAYRREIQQGEPDHDLFWKLHEQFGFKLFARFFALVRADGIDLGCVGEHWPYPDEARSAYTMAYLSIAAGTNLAKLFREHRIGREPPDWKQIHLQIPYVPYEVTAEEVDRVIAVREHLFSKEHHGEGIEILMELYKRGNLYLPSPEFTDSLVIGDSPISFTVTSDFGIESDWTQGFLESAAMALVRVLKIEDVRIPGYVPVSLVKKANLGGIGGGASKTSIDFISDCWPMEQFRFWILSQELAKLIGFHLGGQLPEDWWGHGNKPFATYASVLALREMGKLEVADWVRDMHREAEDHELFWSLHELVGTQWVSRFFRLLREDEIVYERIGQGLENPQPLRTLYIVTYLSLACEKNLAGLCQAHDIIAEPDEVDHLMKLRSRLFGREGEGGANRNSRDRFRRGEIE
jgi:hypothetical protein